MAESDVSVLTSTDRGSGEMEERMGTAYYSAIAHDHLEAFEGGMLSSSCTTSVEQRRAYSVWLEQVESQCTSEEEFVSVTSKPTWTQVAPSPSSSVEGSSSCMSPAEKREIHVKNQQFFQELIKKQPPLEDTDWDPESDFGSDPESELEKISMTSAFFVDFGGRLELGKKIAAGGQAEIFEVLYDGIKPFFGDYFYVMKVFQLEHSEWFRQAWGKEAENIYMQYNDLRDDFTCCFVMNCTLLEDGRFAFLMVRYWGDLRKAINAQILKDKTHLMPPFPPSMSTNIMYQIARGMQTLHCKGTLHRDLKAANVLVYRDLEECMCEEDEEFFDVHVADFESAVGVMGTGFWMAPEVLGILRSRAKDKYTNPTIWTKKVDVYSYAMTCYEVLSGCIPFFTRVANNYNIGDERPPLPDYVDQEIQELLKKCWDTDPSERPTFEIICDELERFSGRKIKCCQALAEDERDADAKRWLRWPFHYIDEGGVRQGDDPY